MHLRNTFFIFLVSAIFSNLAFSSSSSTLLQKIFDRARELKISEDQHWKKLVHYQTGLFGTIQSQVDGESFFLSSSGKTNPNEELNATLESFLLNDQHKDPDSHARCRFPARWIYLKKKLSIEESEVTPVYCKKFEEFKRRLSAQSASLVFSSFYLNNPSSAFGHSLLRINSKKSISSNGRHHELLDTGINYAAEVNTSNPLLYALFGLTGAFHGTFTAVPYYYKVREYNDYEERDLWSYDLNLTPEEIELLVAHIWELGPTHYDYFYFSENCSYHMLTTLEAAAPRIQVIDQLPSYVIPSDTMRVLMKQPDLVSGISYRPSVRTTFEYRLEQLSRNEQVLLKKLIHDQNLSSIDQADSPTRKAQILDTALDYMEFKYPEDLLKDDSESTLWKRTLLLQRAALGIKSEKVDVPLPNHEAPHLGHGVRRFTIENGYSTDSTLFSRFGLRFALHDLLDPGLGYPPLSQIEFAHLNFRYQFKTQELKLDELTLFRVTSLSPITSFKRSTSFRVELGYKNIKNLNCNDSLKNCGAAHFEAGPGLAFQPFGSSVLTLFGFANLSSSYSNHFTTSSLKLSGGPSTGAVIIFKDNLRSFFSLSYRYQVFALHSNSYELKTETVYGLNHNFALGLRAEKSLENWEAGASLKVYW